MAESKQDLGKRLLNVQSDGLNPLNDEVLLGDCSKYKDPFIVCWDASEGAVGTLEFFTEVYGLKTRIPNGRVVIGSLDDNGDALQQIRLSGRGEVYVKVSNFVGSMQMLAA